MKLEAKARLLAAPKEGSKTALQQQLVSIENDTASLKKKAGPEIEAFYDLQRAYPPDTVRDAKFKTQLKKLRTPHVVEYLALLKQQNELKSKINDLANSKPASGQQKTLEAEKSELEKEGEALDKKMYGKGSAKLSDAQFDKLANQAKTLEKKIAGIDKKLLVIFRKARQ